MPVDEFDHKLDVLDGHCREVGRDRSEIRVQLVVQAVLGANEREAAEQLRARADALGVSADVLAGRALAMTPAQLAEHLRPFVDRGVGDFVLMARPPMDRRTLELFAGEVAGTLRA